MANSDEYTATMIALGPGLGACVLTSLPFNSPSLMGTLLLYPTFLGTFLLGVPALGWCLASACLQQEPPGHQRRLIWWAFSLAAPVWHFIVIDASFRVFAVPSPVEWNVTLRYAACLWFVTAAGCLGIARSRTGHR